MMNPYVDGYTPNKT